MSFLSALGVPSVRRNVPLTLALITDAIAAGVAAPVFLLFLVEVAKISISSAGSILAIASLIALGTPAAVVTLISRHGARRTLIWAQILQGCAFGGLVVAVPRIWLLAAFATLAAIGQRMFWSSVFPFIADVAIATEGAGGAPRWFGFAGMVQAAGMAGGSALSSLLLLLNGNAPYFVALTLSCLLFLADAILLALQPSDRSNQGAAVPARPPTRRLLHDRPYLAFTLVNTVFATCTVSLALGLPLYVVNALRMPRTTIGPMLMIVTAINATCQGAVIRLVGRLRQARVIAVAGLFWVVWALSMVLLLAIPSGARLPLLVIATLIFCVAQLLHAPISNSLAAASAPAASRSEYLAFFQYSFALASVITPAAFAWLFVVGPAVPYVVLAALATVAGLAMLAIERHSDPAI